MNSFVWNKKKKMFCCILFWSFAGLDGPILRAHEGVHDESRVAIENPVYATRLQGAKGMQCKYKYFGEEGNFFLLFLNNWRIIFASTAKICSKNLTFVRTSTAKTFFFKDWSQIYFKGTLIFSKVFPMIIAVGAAQDPAWERTQNHQPGSSGSGQRVRHLSGHTTFAWR